MVVAQSGGLLQAGKFGIGGLLVALSVGGTGRGKPGAGAGGMAGGDRSRVAAVAKTMTVSTTGVFRLSREDMYSTARRLLAPLRRDG